MARAYDELGQRLEIGVCLVSAVFVARRRWVTKDSTSLVCWKGSLAMASKVLARGAMSVTGTTTLSAALRQPLERITGAGVDGALLVGVATMIWAAGSRDGCGSRRVGGLVAARHLTGTIDCGDLIDVDEIDSYASRYGLLHEEGALGAKRSKESCKPF